MGHPTTPRDGQPLDPDTVPVREHDCRSATRSEAEEILPLVEETAVIRKREVVTGKVRIGTVTDTIEELARADLQRDFVEVTRVPVDKVVDTAPEIRTEGDVTIVPVLEEVLVVTKQLVLKEELHVRRRVESEAVEVPVSLRKQRAIVEREALDGSTINKEETDR
ncbi:YsnF/AvaK domain-containing protein [Microvirga sp. TS319]|uniref:YsnF/AvaK domain-containing protein n=1 Tax=Microvirga sp. TS319 TaxID=3241165 RepID=UPI00351A13A8